MTALALGAATLTVPLSVMTGAEAARVQPRTTSPTSTLAVIKTISANAPTAVAVNSEDDSVYVTNNITAGTLTVINGGTGLVATAISVDNNPDGVAVNQADDTVYVTNYLGTTISVINGRTGTKTSISALAFNSAGVAVDQSDDTFYVANNGSENLYVFDGRSPGGPVATIAVGQAPTGVAVDQGDDTVYVTRYYNGLGPAFGNTVAVIAGRDPGGAMATIPVGTGPWGVAVDQGDDTVYVTNREDDSVSVINGRTGTVIDTVVVGDDPYGIAVNETDDTVYVTNAGSDYVSVISGRTRTVDDTLVVGDTPKGVAVDDTGTNAGLVYIANADDSTVSVIGRVTPSLSASSGSAGGPLKLTVDAPQVTYDVDDSTVASVTFGTTVIPGSDLTPQTGDQWDFTVPAGSGTVPVTVTFNGGLTASAGDFTYSGSPTPTPPTPASAPRDVTASAGDSSATITWTAPASSGSYPITTYQATSTPAGRTCLVGSPALTCEITGLANGTTYTFTVQALTGAGWGATSSSSNAVTPKPAVSPTILVTGNRGTGATSGRVYANGTTTRLAGETVRARVKVTGEPDYVDGSTRTVSANETFTWQRKTNKKTYVYFTHEAARSNSITIPAR